MMESQAARAAFQLQNGAVQIQSRVERALMWLRPDGWQTRARRNAWGAMVADHQRRHERAAEREAGRGPALVAHALSAPAR
jgi:hypothetical protein